MTDTPIYDAVTLDALDWQPTLPCEFRGNDNDCGAPADWRVVITIAGVPCCEAYCTAHLDALSNHLARCECSRVFKIVRQDRVR